MQTLVRDPRLRDEVSAHPYPLLFATVSGAHLYGFASPDSDYDLRGVHVLPATAFAGLDAVQETIAREHVREGAEIDLVTHEARKFFRLLLRNNGYVLEQLYSPLVVHTTPTHAALQDVARGCITRGCVKHYLGFSQNQWTLFAKEHPRRLKPLLYVYRVLLTGIHLMRTGEVNASLPECNAARGSQRLAFLDALVARKVGGAEQETLEDADLPFHEAECARLRGELEAAAARSHLPERPTAERELKDLLSHIRAAAQTESSIAT